MVQFKMTDPMTKVISEEEVVTKTEEGHKELEPDSLVEIKKFYPVTTN
tara:strand:- start:1202 stop:1345 length:144 start_codon:yes stop_codon:yes gene_type:complete